MENQEEFHYFQKREKQGTDRIYVSKVTEFSRLIPTEKASIRNIRKVYDNGDTSRFAKIEGEIVLRTSPSGRDQVKVVVFGNDNGNMSFVLQKFRSDTGNPYQGTDFSFRSDEFSKLLEFLGSIRFIDLSNTGNFQLSMASIKEKVLVDREERDLLNAFKNLHGESRIKLLEKIRIENLTKEDLDILSGRKVGLETFRKKLYEEKDWMEKEWQNFFENNSWIFGYGLDYRFLSILQREAALSNIDTDGSNTVTGDYLIGSSDFTVLVELKRPDTPLFESQQDRSHSWRLSKDLFNSVSQILAQKSAWEIKSMQTNYVDGGKEIAQRTCDPKSILIIGDKLQFQGQDRDVDIKFRTFERFRRDSRNIEIVTYDELYERAYFIVNQHINRT